MITAIILTGIILTTYYAEVGVASTESAASSGVNFSYSEARRYILKQIFHVDIGARWTNPIFDALLVWLTTVATLNAFSIMHDGLTVWGHVRENHCRLAGPKLSQFLCTMGRTLRIALLSPAMLVYATARAFMTRQRWFTIFNMTFAPRELLHHFRDVGFGVATITLLAVAAMKKLW